jgi:hypothetical protein
MKRANRNCVLFAALLAVLLVPLAAFAQTIEANDPLDRATTYSARYFECNGTFQEKYGIWWMSTANPLKMHSSYSAIWYFEGVSPASVPGDEFVLRLDLSIYTNSKESGGKPSAASVDVYVQNPNTQERYEAKNVRVEMNADEVPIPTYVYVPKKMLTDDGRTVVELRAAGQIGVGQAKLRLLAPQDKF